MAKICTSIEQSKKLIELGLDTNTADMYYIYDGFEEINSELPSVGHKCLEKDIPAWSLSALLGLIPNLDERSPTLCRNIQENKWWVVYHSTAVDAVIQTECYDNPLDAAFEMICWLLENKKI